MAPGLRYGVGGSSRRSRWSLALAFAAALCLSIALPAQASGDSLDQSQVLTYSWQGAPTMAQIFTAGATGQMDRVQLAADTCPATFARVTISIQTVTGAAPNAVPSGTVLGSTLFTGGLTCSGSFRDFSFSPAISVTKGTQYAIVTNTAKGRFSWYNSGGVDAYSLGQLYVLCPGCGGWLGGAQWGMDFAFTTWVVGGAISHPPAVAADNATVNVNEGTAPTNTGTFSGPSGDTITLTASNGTVTSSGTNSGTWSWTEGAVDEVSSQPVTITATDTTTGLTFTTAPFTVTVAAVAPSVSFGSGGALAASTASSPEGTAITLNGSARSPDAEDNTAGFTYTWTVTKNGTNFAAGTGATIRFTPDDEGTFVAMLTATDDGGMAGTASATIAGANVAPSASIAGVTQATSLILPRETLSFGGSFSDPGALDSHTVTWNFGDGATSTVSYGPGGSASPLASHSYSAAGNYVTTLTVTDDDGGVGQASWKVAVMSPQDALSWIATHVVANISTLNAGQRNSLTAKLNAAADSLTRGNTTAANNQLNAFLNEMQADVKTGKISPAQAATLTTDIHVVQAALGTYNRFLEWWPLEA